MIVAAKARVVVLPETALPAFLDRLPPGYLDEPARPRARRRARRSSLGTVERDFAGERYDYYNSVVTRGRRALRSRIRKRHLVPFGEFIPPGFDWVLGDPEDPAHRFRARRRRASRRSRAAGIALGVTICYEDIFGEEVIDAAARGAGAAQREQHRVVRRVASRPTSTCRPRRCARSRPGAGWCARPTPGVTAAIDERGRVVARLPQFTTGTLHRRGRRRSPGTTPYVRWGNAPRSRWSLGLLGLAAWRRRRRG